MSPSLIIGFFMPKKTVLHPYTDPAALDRLLLLIAVFIRYPGIGDGSAEQAGVHRSALAIVATQLQAMAVELGYEHLATSVPTLRKDIEFLRRYGILEDRMYRWGYYLGTGVFTRPELGLAVQALRDLGEPLGDRTLQTLYANLEKRLRGLELGDEPLYPVRSQLSTLIVDTNPDLMREQGNYRETLFEKLPELERAIVAGQPIELYYRQSPYQNLSHQFLRVYPLQLLYHDVAWYLVTDEVDSGYLAAVRLDRLSSHLQELQNLTPRGKIVQRERLKVAEKLFKAGWGISLGSREQQRLELAGEPLVAVKVRFYRSIARFIVEGSKRHSRQRIHEIYDGDGKLEAVDYRVSLPERSLEEFWRWVRRFGSESQVLSPPAAVARFQEEARALVDRYQ
jgi:predicted DNA-binding transcriptional regulator YafY